MEKTDLKKRFRDLYASGKRAEQPVLITVPPLCYLMIDGTGDPGTSQHFQTAVSALYATAYGIKFAAKPEGRDFTVMPSEGLWWSEPPEAFRDKPREEWLWTLLMMLPDWVTPRQVQSAKAAAVTKGKITAVIADSLRFEVLNEGLSAQILHLGPYADEEPTIDRLHEFVQEEGYRLRDKHHEIYLSDPRRVAPEKMKTILRHPVVEQPVARHPVVEQPVEPGQQA